MHWFLNGLEMVTRSPASTGRGVCRHSRCGTPFHFSRTRERVVDAPQRCCADKTTGDATAWIVSLSRQALPRCLHHTEQVCENDEMPFVQKRTVTVVAPLQQIRTVLQRDGLILQVLKLPSVFPQTLTSYLPGDRPFFMAVFANKTGQIVCVPEECRSIQTFSADEE